MGQHDREAWLIAFVREINIFYVILVLYTIPLVLGFLAICVGFVALAITDPGFAQFLLFTLIVGMMLGLPAAFKP